MDKRKSKVDDIHIALLLDKLTYSQKQAVYDMRDGDFTRYEEEKKRCQDTIFKLRSTFDGRDERWTQGMIHHYGHIIWRLDSIAKMFRSLRRPLQRRMSSGKRTKPA